MALEGTDLAILTSRLGCARLGASRLGFCPDDVEGPGATEPGEYIWKEQKPPTTTWVLQTDSSVCGYRPRASFTDVPDPSITVVTGEGPVRPTVQFTDTSTPASEITSWYWDFGDGTTSTEQNPTHVYTVDGVYTVTLYVSSAKGTGSCTGTHTHVEPVG